MNFADIEGLRGRRVIVTGASGFIGRRVVAALAAAGADVAALARERGATQDGVRLVLGDLGRRADLDAAFAGQEVLVHLAYDVRSPAAMNLATFDTVLAVAKQAGIGRIVHASSIVVYDGWPDADLDESASMDRPGGSPYRRAKIEMERRLMTSELPATILQPTLVYGPGSALWTDQFAEWLSSGRVVLPDPEGRCNVVYVDDVAHAAVRAASLESHRDSARYIVSSAGPVAWSDLLGGYAAILGSGELVHKPLADLQTRLGPAPGDGAEMPDTPALAARVSGVARQILGRKRFEALARAARRRLGSSGGDHYPDHHLLELYAARGTCRIDRAQAELGYSPAFGLAEGLAATAPHLHRRFGTS